MGGCGPRKRLSSSSHGRPNLAPMVRPGTASSCSIVIHRSVDPLLLRHPSFEGNGRKIARNARARPALHGSPSSPGPARRATRPPSPPRADDGPGRGSSRPLLGRTSSEGRGRERVPSSPGGPRRPRPGGPTTRRSGRGAGAAAPAGVFPRSRGQGLGPRGRSRRRSFALRTRARPGWDGAVRVVANGDRAVRHGDTSWTRGQADYRPITAVMSNARPMGALWSIQPACRRCSGVAVLPLLGTCLIRRPPLPLPNSSWSPPPGPSRTNTAESSAEMIFGALVLTICLRVVASQRSSAADGLAPLAGRARRQRNWRNLRSLQGVIEEPAAFEEDEVPFMDELADLSMSMLMLVDDGEPDEIFYGSEMKEEEFVENYRYLVNMGYEASHCFITNGSYDAYIIDFIEVNRYDVSVDNGAGGKPVERRYLDRVFQFSEVAVGKAQVHIHPCYDGSSANSTQEFVDNIENDFALVILEDPLPDYITPVKLNSDDSVPTPGVDLQTMGWGFTEEYTQPDRPVTRVALLFTTMAKRTSKLVLLAGALGLAKKNHPSFCKSSKSSKSAKNSAPSWENCLGDL
ncbi:hypothetical protein THAOC_20152 [Thalassiosira oceanica]|uniref:Uncharacterized protein n=1 Tax=Thalassiosira oceanica TaxID=159749 RepID=K0S437_THAOC|nr:hypothetical protein THAOC_20152 [Thalassiosira oceanica]|eukprot:EJK59599.1 hypothetical protein THAOC_20152 [Thalassiosira oceanica]